MKNFTVLVFFSSIISVFSQSASDASAVQSRSETADRVEPAPLNNDLSGNSAAGSSSDASESDTGAQRPISLKKDGMSGYFGYDSRYFYRSNPLATDDDAATKQPTGMWTNTFYAGAGLGVLDMDSAVVTPYIGGSWTLNDYAEGGLGQFNYSSTNAYALLLAQFGNGWSTRAGFSYIMDKSIEFDTEDYRDYTPSLGVMKAYSLSPNTTAIFDASFSLHQTEVQALTDDDKTGKLDNFEITSSYGFKHNFGELILLPKYRLIYKSYDTGSNDGREDFSHVFTLKIDYPLSDSLKLSAFGGYTTRDSNRDNLDYDSYDAGASFGLSARF